MTYTISKSLLNKMRTSTSQLKKTTCRFNIESLYFVYMSNKDHILHVEGLTMFYDKY